jgi:PEP-CTERM motif
MIALTRQVRLNLGALSVGRRGSGFEPDVPPSSRPPIVRLFGIVLLVAGGVIWTADPALASPIKHSHHLSETARLDAELGHSWAAYLMAGPSVWSKFIHPEVTPDLRTAIWKALGSTDAASNPMVEFLLWKQSLDPARFARYHPHVAPILTRISTASLGSQTTAPSTPTSTGPTPVTQPQTLTPTVPEPGPWLLALGMTGWGLWWRRRHR